ncbi:unnamed protein product, partial [Symbiodinium pilosum]
QHLSFDRVRSLLVDTLTSTVTESNKTSVGGGFQPLSWWAQHRYDVEAVEVHGEQKSHDVFGAVYYVGIEHKSKDKVKETIHSQLLSLERQVKKRAAAPKAPESTAAKESTSAALKSAEGEERSGADYSLDLDKELEALLE